MRAAALLAAALAGCEYLGTDVATRIRQSLVEAKAEMEKSGRESATVVLKPNHWPDGCGAAAGYRITLSPYKGNKEAAVGDITIQCHGTRSFYTGFGSDGISVTRDLRVEKKAGDPVRITLKRARSGVEIVALE